MRIDKDAMQAVRLMMELKRRRIFVSLMFTPAKTQLSWWDAYEKKVRTGDVISARHYLNLLDENDRQEMAFIRRRAATAMQGRDQKTR